MTYDVVDIEMGSQIEFLYPGWAIFEATATLSDGSTVSGTVQGDGLMAYAIETFEADEE